MTSLLGVDPGETTGFALFIKSTLVNAGWCSFEDFIADPPFKPDDVVIEIPKWRPHSNEDIDDLLWLARKAGRIEQHYRRLGCRVHTPWPHEWKGSVPKEIHNQRVLRELGVEELARVAKKPRARKHPYDHNMVDGIGLGLWKLGRIR